MAYATSSGIFHLHAAVRHRRVRRPLPVIIRGLLALSRCLDGSLAALTSPQIARHGNITSSTGVDTALAAAFSLCCDTPGARPAHLIRNRPLAQRLKHPALQSLRVFSGLWHYRSC